MTTFRYALMSLANRVGGSDGHAIRRMTWREQIYLTISADGRLRFAETDFGYGYSLEPDDMDADDWVVCPLPKPPVPDAPASGLTFADAVAHLRAHPADTARRAVWVPFTGFIAVDDTEGTVYYHDRDGDAHREMDGAFMHVLATDWEIVPHAPEPATAPEPPKMTGLTLAEAIKIAGVGGYIRRPCWPSHALADFPGVFPDDILATDWEIVPHVPDPVPAPEPVKTTGLTLGEAMERAGENGSIRRLCWSLLSGWPCNTMYKRTLNLENAIATDWEVVP